MKNSTRNRLLVVSLLIVSLGLVVFAAFQRGEISRLIGKHHEEQQRDQKNLEGLMKELERLEALRAYEQKKLTISNQQWAYLKRLYEQTGMPPLEEAPSSSELISVLAYLNKVVNAYREESKNIIIPTPDLEVKSKQVSIALSQSLIEFEAPSKKLNGYEIVNAGDVPSVAPIIYQKILWKDVDSVLESMQLENLSDLERALKLWDFVSRARYPYKPPTEGEEEHDPLRLFTSYGYGYCDDSATALVSLADRLGIPGRVWGLEGHVVSELFVDGKWRMFDPDFGFTFVRAENSSDIVGVTELVSDIEFFNYPRRPGVFYEEYPDRPGWREAVPAKYQSFFATSADNNVLSSTTPDYEGYVARFDDLLTAYSKSEPTLDINKWGKNHYQSHGRAEGRAIPGLYGGDFLSTLNRKPSQTTYNLRPRERIVFMNSNVGKYVLGKYPEKVPIFFNGFLDYHVVDLDYFEVSSKLSWERSGNSVRITNVDEQESSVAEWVIELPFPLVGGSISGTAVVKQGKSQFSVHGESLSARAFPVSDDFYLNLDSWFSEIKEEVTYGYRILLELSPGAVVHFTDLRITSDFQFGSLVMPAVTEEKMVLRIHNPTGRDPRARFDALFNFAETHD